jgi:2-hydroxy-6-oxonona-2,4-dienedioate hydrolase
MKTRPLLWASTILGALGAAMLAAGWPAYQGELRRQVERVSHGSQLVDTPCGRIEFADAGSGPALLLVHGAGGGFDQMLEFVDQFAAAGFRAVAMSRFGYLRTPLPADASPAAQADAHACLLDALGIERAAIVGVSAGAPSTMQFALRHPKRTAAMVLLVPLAYTPRDASAAPAGPSPAARFIIEKATRSDLLYWAAMKAAPSLIARTILGTPPEALVTASAQERARARKLMRQILPLSARRPGLANEAAIAASLPRYELERISTPTLVVSVADDLYGTFDSARYTAAHIPGARFIGYPSGGHLWIGHHDEISAELFAFLGKPGMPLARADR